MSEVTGEMRALAERLADAAGDVLRRYFRTPVAVEAKGDATPVTAADREAEAVMRRMIAETFPDHGIFGEEHGVERGGAEWVWVLDPIDGTKAFITGKPSFGCLIGLMHRGRPVLGIIDQPITRERWLGAPGGPATLNGAAIGVRACDRLDRAYLYATTPEMFTGARAAAWQRLYGAVRQPRYGADCYAYGLLALGLVDLVVECDLKPYDWCALVPVIEAAGGRITDWEGQPLTLDSEGCVAAAGDGRVHAAALAVLRGTKG